MAIPELDLVMYNFMNCDYFMINPINDICVTYKNSQPDFQIYQKKFEHGFLETIHT